MGKLGRSMLLFLLLSKLKMWAVLCSRGHTRVGSSFIEEYDRSHAHTHITHNIHVDAHYHVSRIPAEMPYYAPIYKYSHTLKCATDAYTHAPWITPRGESGVIIKRWAACARLTTRRHILNYTDSLSYMPV